MDKEAFTNGVVVKVRGVVSSVITFIELLVEADGELDDCNVGAEVGDALSVDFVGDAEVLLMLMFLVLMLLLLLLSSSLLYSSLRSLLS